MRSTANQEMTSAQSHSEPEVKSELTLKKLTLVKLTLAKLTHCTIVNLTD